MIILLIMRINKGDKVRVIYGSFRGKEGKVEKVNAARGSVLVSGINTVKRHRKGSGVVQIGKPLSSSKLALVCPKCQKVTKTARRTENNRRVRYCLRCQAAL